MPRRISLSMQRPLTLREAKQRHADIARQYFEQAPTIGNLYNGAVNWLRGKSILTPEGTGMITGVAPAFGPFKSKDAFRQYVVDRRNAQNTLNDIVTKVAFGTQKGTDKQIKYMKYLSDFTGSLNRRLHGKYLKE